MLVVFGGADGVEGFDGVDGFEDVDGTVFGALVGSGGIKISLHLYSSSLLISSNETSFRALVFLSLFPIKKNEF